MKHIDYVTIPLIIPAYEPDIKLCRLIDELKAYPDPIIIVNDGSSNHYDDVFRYAKDSGCVVISNYINLGKGRALKNAFNYCLNEYKNIDGCVTADSDGQHDPKDIIRCRDELKNKKYDLILGCRDFTGKNIPFKSYFGNNTTKFILRYFCGIKVSDTQTGLRGIPKELMIHSLEVFGERFEYETAMLVEAKNMDIDFVEIPISTIYDSKKEHITHFRPVLDSIMIYKVIGRVFFKYIMSSLSSSVVDLTLFSVLCLCIKGYSYYILISTIVARMISATYNYVINHKVVFKSDESYRDSFVKYFFLVVCQMIASGLLVEHIYDCLNINETIIKMVVDVVLFFISFWIQRQWVFCKNKDGKEL